MMVLPWETSLRPQTPRYAVVPELFCACSSCACLRSLSSLPSFMTDIVRNAPSAPTWNRYKPWSSSRTSRNCAPSTTSLMFSGSRVARQLDEVEVDLWRGRRLGVRDVDQDRAGVVRVEARNHRLVSPLDRLVEEPGVRSEVERAHRH